MKLIAWDFDGVLNKGHQGGFDAWQAEFEADLGVSAAVFTDFIFSDGKFNAVLNGERDLLDLLTDYTKTHAVPHAPDAVLDYWLAKDAVIDTQVLSWLTACPIQGVIATNNEQRRADYMWETMGFKAHMAMIFASGPLGVKKPDGRKSGQLTSRGPRNHSGKVAPHHFRCYAHPLQNLPPDAFSPRVFQRRISYRIACRGWPGECG